MIKQHVPALLLGLLILSGIILQAANAQTIPKPSVPQFSIQVVDHSYDVPTTYSTDPYTGKQVASGGYHVDYIVVEGKIKNQQFTPYTIPNPKSTSAYDTQLNIDFYYNISYRGHFGGEWMKLFGSEDVDFLKQDYGSEYTTFNASSNNAMGIQEGATIDFRIQAVIGYETWGFNIGWPYRILNGEESECSTTLTVTISKDATSENTYASTFDNSQYPTLTTPQTVSTPTPSSSLNPTSPNPTPSVPEFPFLIIVPILVIALLAVLAVKLKRGKNT